MECVELAGICDSFIPGEVLLVSPPISREHMCITVLLFLAKNDSYKVVGDYSDFRLDHDWSCT